MNEFEIDIFIKYSIFHVQFQDKSHLDKNHKETIQIIKRYLNLEICDKSLF